eukprot:GHVS01025086.1.p1 GENE.GHVS01025086.1~~GHVS01025086.1.p1  ORF type:complete len:917 (-),score=27.71 GHVS01025086.1:153-2903(-)
MKTVIVLQRAAGGNKWEIPLWFGRHFTVSVSVPPEPPAMPIPLRKASSGVSSYRCLEPTLPDDVLIPGHDGAIETPQQYYIKVLKLLSSIARKEPKDHHRDAGGKNEISGRIQKVPDSWRWVGDNLIRYVSLLSSAQICSVLNLYAKARCRDTSVLFSFAVEVLERLDKFSNTQLILLLHSIVSHQFHHKMLASEVVYTLHSRLSEACRVQGKEKGQAVHKKTAALDCLDCRTLCLLLSSYAKASKTGMLLVAARPASRSLSRSLDKLENHDRWCKSEFPVEEQSTVIPFPSILLRATMLQVKLFDARDVCMTLVAFSQLEYWDSTLLAALCDRILQIKSMELTEILRVSDDTAMKTVSRTMSLTFETVSLLINSLSKFMTKLHYKACQQRFAENDSVRYNAVSALEWQASWLLLKWLQFHGTMSEELQCVVTNSLMQDVCSVNVEDRHFRNQYHGPASLAASIMVCPTLSVERLVNMLSSLASLQPLRQAFTDRNSGSASCRISTRRCFHLAAGVLMFLTQSPHSALVLHRVISSERQRKIVLGESDPQDNDISCTDHGEVGRSVNAYASTVFTAQGVSNCLNAFARVHVQCTDLFVRLVPTVIQLSKAFEPQHVSMTMAAYAAVLVRDKEIMQSLGPVLFSAWRGAQNTQQDTESKTSQEGLTKQQKTATTNEGWGQVASNTLLSLAKLDLHCESVLQFVVCVVLPTCVGQLSLQSTVNIIFSLAYFDLFSAACVAQMTSKTEMPRFTSRPHIRSPLRYAQGSISVLEALVLRVILLGSKHDGDMLPIDREDTTIEPFGEPSTNSGPHSVFSQVTQNQLRIAAVSLQYPSVHNVQGLSKISVDNECFDWFRDLWGPTTYQERTRQVTQVFSHVRTSALHREVMSVLRSLQVLFLAELYVDPYHIDIVLPPDIKE